jgi:quercetin dioxygenase-like cupin family protein
VLGGRARIGIGEEEYEVKQGDVVFIPEGVPHWYQNIGDGDFEFLCMVPNKPDEIKVLDKAGC